MVNQEGMEMMEAAAAAVQDAPESLILRHP